LRIATTFAASAHPEPPVSAEGIRLPRRWSLHRLPLDDKDVEDLRGAFEYAIRQVPGGSPDTSQSSLFLRFIQFEARQARGGFQTTQARERARSVLEHELASSTRLIPKTRRGGRRVTLDGPTLRALRKEAEEIIVAVQEWEPDEATLAALHISLRGDEPEIDSEARERFDIRLARHLRFPLLTVREIQSALDSERRGQKKLARLWVQDRLAADVASGTIKNRSR